MAKVKLVTEKAPVTRLRDTKPGDYFVMLSDNCGFPGEVFVRTWSDEDAEDGAYNIVLLSNPHHIWTGAKNSTALDWKVRVLQKGEQLTVTV